MASHHIGKITGGEQSKSGNRPHSALCRALLSAYESLTDMAKTELNEATFEDVYNLATPEEIIDDARNGRMYILVDAEDRENEGDLIIPAQFATPDAINFMAKFGRGLICLAIENAKAEVLGLTNMSADNRSRFETAFTQSIEAREGVTTGISAGDRSHTIQTAIDQDSRADDIVSPGHMFPIIAKDGGVLVLSLIHI